MTPPRPPRFTPKRRKRWPWALAVFLGAFGIIFALLWWQGNQIIDGFSSGDKKRLVDSARPELGVEPKQELRGLREAQTFLLVGSDVRAGSGETWGRSDTILLVRIYPESKAVSILSLPRDLAVDIPGYGTDKINAAYAYGGPELLIETIREWAGVPIDHYLQIGFEGFASIVDSLGGAYLPVDQRYYHSNIGLDPSQHYSEIDLRPGYQRLDAEQALAFVRYRHGDTDVLRAARQQLFLREVSRQIKEQTAGGIFALRRLAESFADAAASDLQSLPETIRLAETLRKIPPSRVARITVEGTGGLVSGSYLIQVSDREKEETLRLWDNPEFFFSRQEYQRQETPLARVALDWTVWLGRLSRQGRPLGSLQPSRRGAPLADLSQELEDWDPLPDLWKNNFSDLQGEIIFSQTRRYDQGGKSKGSNQDLGDPSLILDSAPAPEFSNNGLDICQPQALPAGYFWPDEATHSYRLEGRSAAALYATRSSGDSILWNWTDWSSPPILSQPEDRIVIGDRRYRLYWESGALRTVAWREGRTQAWITNTLGNELEPREMLALARTCI